MTLRNEHEQLIQHLYRLLRLGNMHDVQNQAVQRSIIQSLPVFHSAMRHHDGELIFLFAGAHIFINGQPLKASRQIYENARELAQLFEQMHANEVVMDTQITDVTIRTLVQLAQEIQSSPGKLPHHPQLPPGLRLSHIKSSLLIGLEDEEQISPHEKVIRICTSTLVVMDRLYERARQGDYTLVRHVKRLARDLVLLAEEHPTSLLTFLNSSSNRVDPAMFSVKGAIMAILTAQKLTRDLRNLADLAMTALLFDSGTIRACGMLKHAEKRGLEFMPKLSEDAADRQPVATATMMAMFGQLNEASLSRSVYSYESHFIQRRHTLGFPYNGQLAPTIESLIIAVVRRYLSLIALDLQREDAEYTVDEAIETLFEEAHTKLEQIILQLFLITLGVFRPGSAVILSSGAKAIVHSNHQKFTQYTRPKILLVYGADGQQLNPPTVVDLSHHHPEILSLGRIKGPINELDDALQSAQASARASTETSKPTPNHVPLSELAGETNKARPTLPQAPRLTPKRPAHLPDALPSTAHEIIIPQSLQENSIWQIPTPGAPNPMIVSEEDEAPVYTISLNEINAISEVRESGEHEVLPPQLPPPLLDIEMEEVVTSAPSTDESEDDREDALKDEGIEELAAHASDAILTPDNMDNQTFSNTQVNPPTHPSSDQVGMVNVNDLMHLFPNSFSELDAQAERQSYLDPTDDTQVSQSPQTWDSTLDDAPPHDSDMAVLEAQEIDDHLSPSIEATTLLPRDVIATFQFYDQTIKQQKDDDANTDQEAAAPSKET